MSAKLIPANPADLMVTRSVTPNIVTFSVPFSRFGRLRIGGRGTVGRCWPLAGDGRLLTAPSQAQLGRARRLLARRADG